MGIIYQCDGEKDCKATVHDKKKFIRIDRGMVLGGPRYYYVCKKCYEKKKNKILEIRQIIIAEQEQAEKTYLIYHLKLQIFNRLNKLKKERKIKNINTIKKLDNAYKSLYYHLIIRKKRKSEKKLEPIMRCDECDRTIKEKDRELYKKIGWFFSSVSDHVLCDKCNHENDHILITMNESDL